MTRARVGFWIRYALFLGVVCTVALEVALRVFGLAPAIDAQYKAYVADARIQYRPKPDSVVRGTGSSGEFDFEYRHNSMGFRDVERPSAKPPGTFRILGLGDSFTYGAGAGFEDTYLFVLEQRLNEHTRGTPPVEVIKAGISAGFAESERKLLEAYGLPYSPDLVLVGFLPNDVVDTERSRHAITVSKDGYLVAGDSALGEFGTWLYLHSHLWRLVRLKSYFFWSASHWPDVYRGDGYHEPSWQKLEQEYARIAELTRGAGARLVVLHIPMPGPWNASSSYPAQRLAAWCRENGALFVDALPALKEAAARDPGTPLYWPKDGHCTPAGYRIIGDVTWHALVEAGLAPSPALVPSSR